MAIGNAATGSALTTTAESELAIGNTGTGSELPTTAGSELPTGNTGSMGERHVRPELGYRLLGSYVGKGSFGSVFPAIWKDGPSDVGELAMVKDVPIERPYMGPSTLEVREVAITSALVYDNVYAHVASLPDAICHGFYSSIAIVICITP